MCACRCSTGKGCAATPASSSSSSSSLPVGPARVSTACKNQQQQLSESRQTKVMSKVKSAAAAAPPSPPKVPLSADRVTFTVESGIKISSRETMHSKQTAPASDGPEALWLKEFTQYIRTDHRQRESPERRSVTQRVRGTCAQEGSVIRCCISFTHT